MAPSPSNLASMAKIAAHESVYPPAEDSFLLVDALAALWDDELARSRPKLCIELGTGSGYIACSNALLARAHGCGDVTRTRASDINPDAVAACRATCEAHGVSGTECATALGDLLEPHADALADAGGCDVLVFNPPYVVTPSEEVGGRGIEASWAGGARGREVLDRLLPSVRSALAPRGMFLCILLAQNEPEEVMEIMRRDGLRCSLVSSCNADEEALFVLRCDRDA
jgi:release factor glutamine methyltransferase